MRGIKYLIILITTFVQHFCFAQTDINEVINRNVAERHIKYLASDQMQGRDTGSPELDTAAQYIAGLFSKWGVKKVEDKDSYFQQVPLQKTTLPKTGELVIADSVFSHAKDALMLKGDSFHGNVEMIYAHYAKPETLDSLDIEGKVVVARFGYPEIKNTRKAFSKWKEKRDNVKERGGIGVIELARSKPTPWPMLVLYLNNPGMSLGEDNNTSENTPFHFFLDDSKGNLNSWLSDLGSFQGQINLDIEAPVKIKSKNVIGYVEGNDPSLKNEYVVLTAHYDHIGTGPAKMKDGQPADTIYNGARDNALGTTGMLLAAKYFAKNPPKRSILFIAFTAEEKGLLGSEFYANHPWIPLSQCIFNLNIDCAGYNDTTKVTVFGLTRNTAREHFESASKKYGLKTIKDPIPEQNIFARSDHYNFAQKGVPCVLFSPGVVSFDAEIQQYYHQVVDHAETLNFNYLTKYYSTFVEVTRKIANDPEMPFWTKGDEFEKTGKELYNMP